MIQKCLDFSSEAEMEPKASFTRAHNSLGENFSPISHFRTSSHLITLEFLFLEGCAVNEKHLISFWASPCLYI